MYIPSDLIDKVRLKVNILDVIGSRVDLHKSGQNWFGLCPFHNEKTPSFSVNEQKQIFNCFSCHRGGNVYKFLMDMDGLSFYDSFCKIAEMGGIHLDKKFIKDNNDSTIRKNLIRLYSEISNLYHHILMNTQLGQQALDYLYSRGMNNDIINQFNLGFAPETNILKKFVKTKNIDYDLLRRSGLFLKNFSNNQENIYDNFIDRFRNRIMFPICNLNGEPIAFSGRLIFKDSQSPKYLNSPETIIFNKSKNFFNLDKAKPFILQQKKVFLFEGFMDVIAAYRSGILNSIASMGTSLTEYQIKELWTLTHSLYICYDGDDAGQLAIKNAIEHLKIYQDFNLKIVNLPNKLDPDDILNKYGQNKFKQIIQNDYDNPINFFIKYYAQIVNLQNEDDQAKYIIYILKELVYIKNPIERELYLNKISKHFGVDYNILLNQLISLDKKNNFSTNKIKYKDQKHIGNNNFYTHVDKEFSKLEKAERLLLYRIFHNHNIFKTVRSMSDFSFAHEKYQLIYDLFEGYCSQYEVYQKSKFLHYVKDKKLQNIVMDIENDNHYGNVSDQEFNDYIDLIMSQYPIDKKLNSIDHQIESAKLNNDESKILSLVTKKINLLKEKHK